MPIPRNTAKDLALMSKGSYGKGGDVQDHYLWDTVLFPAAIGEMAFFTIPIGGTFGAGTKTKIETNLSDPRKLPAGQSFLCKKIKFDLILIGRGSDTNQYGAARDFNLLMNYSRWTINIAGKDYEFEAPGTFFMPTIHELGAGGSANQNRVGDYNSHSWTIIRTPITFGELVSFDVTAEFNSGLAAIRTALTSAFANLNGLTAALRTTIRGTLTRSK
jgi:hypothetical protein